MPEVRTIYKLKINGVLFYLPQGGGGGGTSNYPDLSNKPSINGVELSGNKTAAQLGINVPTKTSDLENDSGYLTEHQSLDGYATEQYVDGEVNDLQGQIDAIVSRSDVVDVVGTYAELQAYDTSSLGNNDVVKVLTDSTHSNARSYYRWLTATNSWEYIGSESVGYTKAETDNLLADKLDKAQGVEHAGEFLVVGADGNVSPKAIEFMTGGSY